MTPSRARDLIKRQPFASDIPRAYRESYETSTKVLDPTGITEDENRFILAVWERMPGHTCYMDALYRVARGKVTQCVICAGPAPCDCVATLEGLPGK